MVVIALVVVCISVLIRVLCKRKLLNRSNQERHFTTNVNTHSPDPPYPVHTQMHESSFMGSSELLTHSNTHYNSSGATNCAYSPMEYKMAEQFIVANQKEVAEQYLDMNQVGQYNAGGPPEYATISNCNDYTQEKPVYENFNPGCPGPLPSRFHTRDDGTLYQ